MLNYLRAECYKIVHRKYTWISLAIVLALEALLVSGWVFMNLNENRVDFYTGACMLITLLYMGFLATMITGDIVFSEQYKHNTLKNEVSFGLPRARIYLGKLIAQTLLAIFACMVIVGFYLGLCALFLPHEPEADRMAMTIIGWCLLVALPLWVGVQGLTCAVFFMVRSSMAASLVVVGVIMGLPSVFQMGSIFFEGILGQAMAVLYQYLPTTMLADASSVVGVWVFCGKAWLVGSVWLAASTALGLWSFSRKEIA